MMPASKSMYELGLTAAFSSEDGPSLKKRDAMALCISTI
jgi:hypothetical protein